MRTFVIGDTHLGHKGMVHFTNEDGTKLRPWNTIEEHDANIIHNWNSVVQDGDLVYMLGDFTMNRRHIQQGKLLKGRKKLIMGNHDNGSIQEYLDAGFESLHACIALGGPNILLSHIPVHTAQLARYTGGNIHGHLHSHKVMRDTGVDTRYLCVSCEHISFTPMLLDRAIEQLQEQQHA